MADIKNYTLNFGCGRPLCGLNLADAKLAFAEIERSPLTSTRGAYG